jgi:hypothetical protein
MIYSKARADDFHAFKGQVFNLDEPNKMPEILPKGIKRYSIKTKSGREYPKYYLDLSEPNDTPSEKRFNKGFRPTPKMLQEQLKEAELDERLNALESLKHGTKPGINKGNDLPSPDSILRITEEIKGVKYRIHFKKTKITKDIFAISVEGFYKKSKGRSVGIEFTRRWGYFLKALNGEPLNSIQRFRVNKSFRWLFNDNDYDFFDDSGTFKYLLPIKRKHQTFERLNSGYR